MSERADIELKKESSSLLEELRAMEHTNIRTVNPEDLVEIDSVQIDPSLPVEERMQRYLEQIKNPYCYLCNGVVVKISFAGNDRLEDCLARALTLK